MLATEDPQVIPVTLRWTSVSSSRPPSSVWEPFTLELRPWKATDPLGMNATSDSDCMSCGGEGRRGKGREGEGRGREGKGREGEGRGGKGREGEGKGRGGEGRGGEGRGGKEKRGEGRGREGRGREGRGEERENGRGGVDSEVQLLEVNAEVKIRFSGCAVNCPGTSNFARSLAVLSSHVHRTRPSISQSVWSLLQNCTHSNVLAM